MITAKAWVAAFAVFLTALLAEWTGGEGDPFQPRDLVVALVAALVSWGAVYTVPNRTTVRRS